jgi:hypothetical protein
MKHPITVDQMVNELKKTNPYADFSTLYAMDAKGEVRCYLNDGEPQLVATKRLTGDYPPEMLKFAPFLV